MKYDRLLKDIKKDPYNRAHRFELSRIRKLYKSAVKENKASFEKGIWSRLDNFYYQNPQQYWKLLKDLRNLDNKYNKNPVPISK